MQNRNTTAVSMLATLGYSLPCIRKALHKLTGITQPELAKRLGVSRPTITATIDGARGSDEIRTGIAREFDVPVKVLFGEPLNQTNSKGFAK
jgi:transcriptional regulator with XRE-family HTH domain